MKGDRREGLFLRSDFSSSRLVRLLGAWSPAPADPGLDFAERLGLWVSAFDAIGLQGALQPQRAKPVPVTGARSRAARLASLQEQLQRVRQALAHAIAQDPVALAGADPALQAYAPFQRRHSELQRHMEQMLAPLREQVRQALAQTSPALRQLAALDAVIESMLGPREQQHLAGLPAWLARRFEQCRQAALAPQLALSSGEGDAAPDWVHAFAQDWRQVLLAELQLRLEPVAGLLAALNDDTTD